MTDLDKSSPELTGKIRELQAKAKRAREHAARIDDATATANLNRYAAGLEAEAEKLHAEDDEVSQTEAPDPSNESVATGATLALKPQKPDRS